MKKHVLVVTIALISLCFVVGCANANQDFDKPDKKDIPPASEIEEAPPKIVLENEAFKIFEPTPETEVQDKIIVKGLARVWEATVQYEFEDGHFILNKGFTTATKGAPEWGDFEIAIDLENAVGGSARVVLFEASAKDGSRLHELIIPVIIVD